MDYAKALTTAKRLTSLHGRQVTFIQLNTAPTDAEKPWRGNNAPRDAAPLTLALNAVFVAPSSNQKLGLSSITKDLFKTSEQMCIVATSEDLSVFNEVVDADGIRWKIKVIEKLKPGNVTVLYYVGLSR